MDARQQKARLIVAGGRINSANGHYFVPSQSGRGFHCVTLDGLFPTCSCDDHELTNGECKHIIAARLWREQGEKPAPVVEKPAPVKRKTYSQDWPNYDLAQTREKGHFQTLLADLCRVIPEPAPKGGIKGGRPAVPLVYFFDVKLDGVLMTRMPFRIDIIREPVPVGVAEQPIQQTPTPKKGGRGQSKPGG